MFCIALLTRHNQLQTRLSIMHDILLVPDIAMFDGWLHMTLRVLLAKVVQLMQPEQLLKLIVSSL